MRKERAGVQCRPVFIDSMEKDWFVYMIECVDGSLYTGITVDIVHRLEVHRSGKGAKYTRGRGPLTVRYLEKCESYSQALRREAQIKRLPRKEKLLLCQQYITGLQAD